MRMFFVVFVLFIVAATLASAAVNTVYYGKSPRIDVDLASQDPDPVEPGKIVEVSFKLDNKGELANDVVFEIIPEYPFSILPGESAVKNIGTLGTAQDTVRSVFVKYKLKVDQNAVDGNQELKIRYKSSDSESWITIDNTTIKVQSKEAILSVEKFAAVPESVAPGSKTRLAVSLRNHANSLLKDIKVTLDLGKSSDEETPFAPVGSTNEKVIPFIDAQATSALEFNLIADPDAKSKVYKVPLKLQYSDILNKNYSKTLTLALVVGVEPDISVYVDTTSVYTAGSTGDISVKIVNKGLSDLKFLNVKLDKSEKYKVLSPYEVYIGNIDSDDYETADFKLSIEKTRDKKLLLPVAIEYKDANNQDYTKNVNLELTLYTKSEAKKLGLTEGNGTSWVFAAVILLAAGFFAYRLWKKRRK
ncbi:hypothetical protein HYX05_01200 [Candidatus Woesearchaeota archaeon]|nr:hypothetical protein [Candidatus Woesearchaeota archaeon]